VTFKVVIPARFASTRLPGKPLLDIAGKPLIQYVYEQAVKSDADEIVIATDDARIETAAKKFGAQVCITSAHHRSGTERIAEVLQTLQFSPEDIVVNLQGDEPLMPAAAIAQVAEELAQNAEAKMSTLCARIENQKDLFNPNIVKVVRDTSGFALYFSRSPLPWDRAAFPQSLERAALQALQNVKLDLKNTAFYRHIGLYAYRVDFVTQYVSYPMSPLEQTEALEQLRALENGHKIYVGEAREAPGIGVDTEEDLAHAREILEAGKN
jgi:3-deoxy-manno-octulosonate cytidylyltransferase (CMP-KDO synthetase)